MGHFLDICASDAFAPNNHRQARLVGTDMLLRWAFLIVSVRAYFIGVWLSALDGLLCGKLDCLPARWRIYSQLRWPRRVFLLCYHWVISSMPYSRLRAEYAFIIYLSMPFWQPVMFAAMIIIIQSIISHQCLMLSKYYAANIIFPS